MLKAPLCLLVYDSSYKGHDNCLHEEESFKNSSVDVHRVE